MKRVKITMISGAALLLAFVLATTAVAQQRNRARQGLRIGIAQMIDLQQFIGGLRLTNAQREEIRALFQSHRTEILNAREAVLRARLALVKNEPNGPADFGAAQTQVVALRQQILDGIKTKLTPEQLDMVQKRLQRQADRLEAVLKNLESREKP